MDRKRELFDYAIEYRLAQHPKDVQRYWAALQSFVDRLQAEAYAEGRADQREEDSTDYASEQVETARSLESMRD